LRTKGAHILQTEQQTAVLSPDLFHEKLNYINGWRTLIRTKIDGVRARRSVVRSPQWRELSLGSTDLTNRSP
jgi:hypothetical protein